MLVTEQSIMRRFWYPVAKIQDLAEEPRAATLLGTNMVLWLGEDGSPAATVDMCSHRFARLSSGRVVNGHIECPYHGWTYDRDGACTAIPQFPEKSIPAGCRVQSFACEERYGYAWVCLQDPIAEIPHVAEADDGRYRVIHLPNQVWKCSPIAALENLFDNAHHHYVHTLLGDRGSPEPLKPETIEETDDGIYFKSDMRNHTTPLQRNVWGIEDDEIILDREFSWHMPFFARIALRLPNGLRNVTLILFSPISKSETLWTNIVFRNDAANPSATADDVIKLGLAIGAEDQAILETLHLNVPLDPKMQQHMATDKPGIIMRRKFSDLLRANKEVERSPSGMNPQR